MGQDTSQQRRLAAIMFTDMVGYSALSQKNEALALELLNEHRKILRELFASYGGREIEAVGDGFFVECPSALAAAQCAVEIQRALHDRNASQSADRQILVRIGLHLGDVVVQDTRVHGDGVTGCMSSVLLARSDEEAVAATSSLRMCAEVVLPPVRTG